MGYKKPPRASQFQKGRSGNPKGRPRASTSPDELLARELNKKITPTENNRRKQITKSQARMAQLVNKAISGHSTSLRHVFRYNERLQIKCDEIAAQQVEKENRDPINFTDEELMAIIQESREEKKRNKPDQESDCASSVPEVTE